MNHPATILQENTLLLKRLLMQLRSLILSFLFIVICFHFSQAQYSNPYRDVVYLKDGSIIKGVIIEQIPGKSIRLKTADGNELNYEVSQIEKFGREEIISEKMENAASTKACKDSTRNFYFKSKGYFGQVQLSLGLFSPGVRVVNGYRFGRFGILGIGVGVDVLRMYQFRDRQTTTENFFIEPTRFIQVPIFLHYEMEILKKKVTPIYFTEIGYCLPINRNSNYDFTRNEERFEGDFTSFGSVYNSSGIGLKIRSRKRFNTSILFDYKIYGQFGRATENIYNAFGDIIDSYTDEPRFGINISPGVRVVFGF